MRKTTLFSLFLCCLLALLMLGCKSMYQRAYGNSPLCLAYSSDIDFIKDQSQLSTIVLPINYGLVIDSIEIITTSGQKFNQDLRSSKEGNFGNGRIIDILPGEHALEVRYSGFGRSGGKYVSTYTKEPIVQKFDFKPGEVYYLELKLANVAAKLMSFKKTDFNSLDGVILTPLKEEHKQIVIDFRNRVSIK